MLIQPIQPPPFEHQAALYFLDGHYLFRWQGPDGKVLSKFVSTDDLAAAFSGHEADSGWLPPGVVRAGYCATGPFFVFFMPPRKVALPLLAGEQVTPKTLPIPATVLLGVGPVYYLWAVRGKTLDPQAYIYHAPFPNVYDDGRICWGANTPPAAHLSQAQAVWDLFFTTPFNDHLARGKSNAYSDDVRQQLHRLARRRARVYPVNDLNPYYRSLADLVERVIHGG